MSDRPTEGLPEDPPDAASENGGTFVALVDRLEAGSLSAEEQRRLADLLVAGPPELVMAATRHESYSGPLPHPDLLNRFDEPLAAPSCRWRWMSRCTRTECGSAAWKALSKKTAEANAME